MKKDKGLGDTIERITNATGISKIVNSVTKECSCKKRKDKLNRLFPYQKGLEDRSPNDMTTLQWLEFIIKQ
jgi:hypothetical protein